MRSCILLLLTLSVTMALEHSEESQSAKRGKRELLRRAKRRWVLSTIELTEEDKGPFPKNATQLFNDREVDYELVYHISGMGVDLPPKDIFSIDSLTGMVQVLKSIDREKFETFHIKFDVQDKRTGKLVDTQLAFDVDIIDINDKPPVFASPLIKVNIKENLNEEIGDLPVSLKASDEDQKDTDNSKITMTVLSQEPLSPKIGIKTVEGAELSQLTFTGCFDYDKAKEYKVLVLAKDHGTPPLSAICIVMLSVEDANNHLPVFTQSEYKAKVMEMSENIAVLKLAVTDKDTPNTAAWRAKYTIVKGNEDENYKIETDPKTNEGILTVIKAKDYEMTTKTNLEIKVENEEPLFVCRANGGSGVVPAPQTVNVAVTVLNVNDEPVFSKKKAVVYVREEDDPGEVLYKPKVTDVDSINIRYEIAQDAAKWVTIDSKTGVVKSVQKMDRESLHVNNSIYTVVIHAIDDGDPPGTGTGTLLVHLTDQNDNLPYLLTKNPYICGNRDKGVDIEAEDKDVAPFGAPFTFSLQGEDKARWKLDPDTGEKATLTSIKPLPFGNYTVLLTIQDQQGKSAKEELYLTLCDCGQGTVCKGPKEKSTALGGSAIATLFAGILMLLLLLCLCLFCACGKGKHEPMHLQDEGNQTLIKYNEEGGSSACKAEPPLLMTPTSSFVATDGVKLASMPLTQMSPGFQYSEANGTLRSQGMGMAPSGFQQSETTGTLRSQSMGMGTFNSNMSMRAQWNTRMNSNRSKYSRSQSLRSQMNISELIERRLYVQKEDELDFPGYQPDVYTYEGTGSRCPSLDKLSLSSCGEDLDFLQHLGPKFNTLDGICRQAIKEKDLKL
ncbi:hypothetical protein AAFF_G00240310 [Aldrovandia affinis]|uniref:Cadherin domain-containing protein n=1 Tax=Aldrovandia affinis TaxID=143900 RepID=A0AAD7SUG5_9TELE|nr:hypothetical protein AAFF_G00240310 [Aldrovandia affinis]